MLDRPQGQVVFAETLDAALKAQGAGASVLAGGTWTMRAERRGETMPTSVVILHRIPALSDIAISERTVTLGAGLSHAALADALQGVSGLEGVVAAALGAANPAIRHAATLGGNLSTPDFPAADLVPALLAQGTEVVLAIPDSEVCLPLDDFLRERRTLLRMAILVSVRISRTAVRSAHARLPLRKAGDYPVAIVSLARLAEGSLRIAVGSVEPVARRWTALEAAIGTVSVSPEEAADLARAHNDFTGRDGVEAEGWYRVEVLPTLVRRAVAALGSPA